MSKLNVVAILKFQEGKVNEVIANILPNLVSKSRAEPGTVFYDAFVDINDPNVIVFNEQYVNQEAFNAHKESAHFNEAIEQLKAHLAAAPELRLLNVVAI